MLHLLLTVISSCSDQVLVKVVLSELIAGEDIERVAVDLDITTDRQVCSSQELVVIVDVLVLSAMKELALDNARVLLGRFIHAN